MAPRRALRTVPSNPGRAVLYIRVSKLAGRSGADFHSPELQAAAMRRVVAAAGLREVAVITDIDVSGRTFTREGLDRLRTMVEAREVDVVAVYDLSRLGRNTSGSLRFVAWLKDHGVGIVSTVEQISDTPEGSFMLGQFLGMAQLTSDQIGRRWIEIIGRRAAEQGLPHGHAPMGYLKVGKGIEPDPGFRQVITDLFSRYAKGESVGPLVRWMSAERGTPVARDRVKRILRNRIYCGEVRSLSEWLPGRHEALVDPDTWERVQERLARDTRTPARLLAPKYALTGLLFCAECEHRLTIWPSKPHGGTVIVPRARCRWVVELGAGARCSGPGNPRIADIEAIVLDRLATRIRELRDDAALRGAKLAQAATAGADLARAQSALADTQAAMSRVLEEWARGLLPDPAYRRTMASLGEAERAQSEAVAALRSVRREREPQVLVNLYDRMSGLWDEMEGGERNELLREMVEKAIVRRGTHQREPMADRVKVLFR